MFNLFNFLDLLDSLNLVNLLRLLNLFNFLRLLHMLNLLNLVNLLSFLILRPFLRDRLLLLEQFLLFSLLKSHSLQFKQHSSLQFRLLI